MEFINSIISGIAIFKIGKEYAYVKPPSAEDRAFADFFSQEQYDDALIDGIWTQEDAEKHLISTGYLGEDYEEQVEQIKKAVDNMKVDYFNHFYDSTTKEYIKRNIEIQEKRQTDIHNRKYAFYDKTCDYLKKYAFIAYCLQKNALFSDGELVSIYYSTQAIYNKYINVTNAMGEKIREIAKTNEWKNRWYSSKFESFENPASSFTDVQLSLISWSTFYDGVYQSFDKPSEDIINDDIAIDGWSIVEKRKRKEEEKKKNAEKMLPKNVQNAGEVFIPARNQKQASDIMALNSAGAKGKIRSLQNDVNKHGKISDSDLTSTRNEIQMEALRQQKERRRR